MESKWVLFILITFTIGNLLASAIDDNFTGADDLAANIDIITPTSIDDATPSDASEDAVRSAGIRTIGLIRDLIIGLPAAMQWDYSFLESGAGQLFKWIFLYPLSFMFSMMILGFLRSIIRI